MLQLIVLGHEVGQHFGKLLNLRGQLELFDQAIRVLLQFLRLQLLIGEQLIDALVQLLNLLAPLLVLSSLVAAQVLEQDLGAQLCEGCSEDVRLELEELIDNVLVLHRVEDVSGQSDHVFEWFVQKVALESQLELADVLSCDALVVQREKFCADGHRVDVLEAHGEEHLAVTMEFFEHVRVAVFEDEEELLDPLKDQFFRLGRVYPFGQVIEQMFLEDFSILLSSQLSMNRAHTGVVRRGKRLLCWAAVEIQNEQIRHVCHLSRQCDHKSVLQIKLAHMMTVAKLNRYFSQWVVIEPQLLQVCKFADLRRQFHNIVEAKIQADQIGHGENLGKHLIQIHLRKMQSI